MAPPDTDNIIHSLVTNPSPPSPGMASACNSNRVSSSFLGWKRWCMLLLLLFQVLERVPRMTPRGHLVPDAVAGDLELRHVSFAHRVHTRTSESEVTAVHRAARRKAGQSLKVTGQATNTPRGWEDPLDNERMPKLEHVPVLTNFSLRIRAQEQVNRCSPRPRPSPNASRGRNAVPNSPIPPAAADSHGLD